jgi:hypothetical protein
MKKKVQQWFTVRINYTTTAGNPATKGFHVRAYDEADAITKASEKVWELKRCMKVNDGHIESSDTPAPVDWEQEADRLAETREKAIAYITKEIMKAKLMPLPTETGCVQVAFYNDRLEFSQKPPRDLFRTVAAADLTLDQLVATAKYIQKAIAAM